MKSSDILEMQIVGAVVNVDILTVSVRPRGDATALDELINNAVNND